MGSPPGAPSGELRPGSVVPPERVLPARRGRRWRVVLLAVPVLLVVGTLAAVAAGRYLGQPVAAAGSPAPGVAAPNPAAPSPAGPSAADPTSAPASPPAGTPPSPATPPLAPPGYQIHHEPDGYWVAIPTGWETDPLREGGRQWWGDVSRGEVNLLFVTIKVVTVRPQTARTALTAYENKAKHNTSNIFYQRLKLVDRPRPYGASSAAELEFTDRDYADGAQTWHYHTLVRALVTPGNRLYTAEFMILHDIYNDSGSTEGDWRQAVPTVQKILASLRLG